MLWLRTILSRLKGSTQQAETQTDLSEELRSHLEMLVEEKTAQGMAPDEARRQAVLTLGNNTQIREAYREQAGLPFFEVLLQDIRYALRTLRRYPGFAAVAIVTLALGIGANTAIFSIVNGVLLQPLPYANHDGLVSVFSTFDKGGNFDDGSTSPPDFRTLRAQNHTFVGLSAYYTAAQNLTGIEEPERLQSLVVSADYFTTLSVKPAFGRNFLAGEEQWGAHHVAIVSNAFWRTRLNSDRNLAGKTLTLNGDVYSVIGVMPRDFYVQRPIQLWVPMAWKPKDNDDTHNNYFLSMIGRLRPGVTHAQAASNLNAIMLGIAQQFPENKGIGADLKSLREAWLGDVRPALMVLLAAVGSVLLIACVNLANLLLARSAGRQKEIAIRSAIGANRARLLRQFITESVLLSLIGGGFGLTLASLALRILPLTVDILPRADQIRLDGWVLLFTLAVSSLTGILFGLMPAFQNSRPGGVNESLKEGGRNTSSRGNQRLRGILVTSEVALALLLLIASGLAIKSFARLLHVNAGFVPDHVLTFTINLPDTYDPQRDQDLLRIGAAPRVIDFFENLLARIEQLPGVKAAGSVSSLPLKGENWGKLFVALDRPIPSSIDKLDHIQYRAVLGHYFNSLQIPLIKGRFLNDHDRGDNPFVAVVNQTLARHYWPGQEAIGKNILLSPPENLVPAGLAPPGYHPQKFTIVGVVADVHYGGMDNKPLPLVYASVLQHDSNMAPSLTVRSDGDPRLLTSLVRDIVKQIDKNIPLARVMTMDEILSTSVAQPRLVTILLGLFGILALILASVGIYGVLAYSVSQRTSEIGIRMALGASRSSVLRMVLRQGLRLTGIGLAIGLVLALGLTRLMSGVLFGVSPTDPATFTMILLLLGTIAMLASYLPARHATRVDPMVALRYE
jgi:predicted permease